MASEEAFNILVKQAEFTRKSHRQLGGNAALLADRIASSFPATEVSQPQLDSQQPRFDNLKSKSHN